MTTYDRCLPKGTNTILHDRQQSYTCLNSRPKTPIGDIVDESPDVSSGEED
jgi:hypothetical protein